jgi:hypothetical protein
MSWLSSVFSIRAILMAAGYSVLLLIAYRRAGWRGGVGVAALAFVLFGASALRALLGIGSLASPSAYVIVGAVLLGHVLLPALWVHRVNRRKPTEPVWPVLAGIAGYFLAEIVITGVAMIVVIAHGLGGG